jgi:N utilization substance protein B
VPAPAEQIGVASRRKGRILAFQALYSWESGRIPPVELMTFSWLEAGKRAALDEGTACFSRLLIAGTIENIKAVDEMIKKHLQNPAATLKLPGAFSVSL